MLLKITPAWNISKFILFSYFTFLQSKKELILQLFYLENFRLFTKTLQSINTENKPVFLRN